MEFTVITTELTFNEENKVLDQEERACRMKLLLCITNPMLVSSVLAKQEW